MLKTLSLLALLLTANACSARGNNIDAIDSFLSDGVSNGFSGAVLIAHEGKVVLSAGYGYADRELKIKNTPETVFDIGSVTKQFTAAATMKLVEIGKLRVTDRLSSIFPKIPDDKAGITIHQLLTHTAGFVDNVTEGDFEPIKKDEFFQRVFSSKLLFTPGERYEYSNVGYSILAGVIELTAKQEYEAFLTEFLFQPAGMSHTGYLKPQWDQMALAQGYRVDFEKMGSTTRFYEDRGHIPWPLLGNGGINSTVQDMYLWHQALTQHRILSPQSIDILTTPYVAETVEGESHYAYGWAIYRSSRDTKIISHNGGNNVFFHDVLWMPEERTLILFATNATSRHVEVAWALEKMWFDPSHHPAAIDKNLFDYVRDFVADHNLDHSDELVATVKARYAPELRQAFFLNRLGYKIMGDETIAESPAWAAVLFKLNTALFPDQGNLWDSLGDAYSKAGRIDASRESYQRAAALGFEESAAKLSLLP